MWEELEEAEENQEGDTTGVLEKSSCVRATVTIELTLNNASMGGQLCLLSLL